MSQRNETIDIMKGFGIIAVIIGHMGILPYVPFRHFIFSFHMPLFFILAGYFFKPNPDFKGKWRKDFSRLVIPYIFTASVLLLFNILQANVGEDKNTGIIMGGIIAALYGSGTTHTSPILGNVQPIGAIWFLLALFWCRVVYNAISCNTKYRFLVAGIIAVLAILLDRYVINLPFAILPGLSAMMFYLVGDWLRNNKATIFLIVLCLVCWVISLLYSRIIMVACHYYIYPVDVLGACGGTAFIYWISNYCVKTKLKSVFVWLGINSLIILCFHLIELNCKLCGRLHIPDVFYYQFPVKLIFCVLMTWLCYKFRFTRSVFGLK